MSDMTIVLYDSAIGGGELMVNNGCHSPEQTEGSLHRSEHTFLTHSCRTL